MHPEKLPVVASVGGRFYVFCAILLSSGSMVQSIVMKHKLPPIIFDTGSARNTPSVPMCRAYGII